MAAIKTASTSDIGGRLGDVYSKARSHFLYGIDPGLHCSAYVGEHCDGFAESEFAGKYLDTSACCYRTDDGQAIKNAARVAASIAENQRADGYTGGYTAGHEWNSFSVWNQTFTVIGLVSYYQATGDKSALSCAERSAEYIARHFMYDSGADICNASNYGTQHLSFLLAATRLYKVSPKPVFRDFILHMVNRIRSSDNNFFDFDSILDLRSKKGIENFVILLGILEYGELFGDPTAFAAVRKYRDELAEKQIDSTGNGTVGELWTSAGNRPGLHDIKERPNENCVAVGWAELNLALFLRERNGKYIDALEAAVYNHLLGAIEENGRDFAYYQPNFGKRITVTQESAYKCCRYRGYSLVGHIPDMLFWREDDTVTALLYSDCKYSDGTVTITEKSEYPYGGEIRLSVTAEAPVSLKLRIPSAVKSYEVSINGTASGTNPESGYITVPISAGSTEIALNFDVRIEAVYADVDGGKYVSYRCGNIQLSLENDGDWLPHEVVCENLPERVSPEKFVFRADGVLSGKAAALYFTDYASSGRDHTQSFSVWVGAGRK